MAPRRGYSETDDQVQRVVYQIQWPSFLGVSVLGSSMLASTHPRADGWWNGQSGHGRGMEIDCSKSPSSILTTDRPGVCWTLQRSRVYHAREMAHRRSSAEESEQKRIVGKRTMTRTDDAMINRPSSSLASVCPLRDTPLYASGRTEDPSALGN